MTRRLTAAATAAGLGVALMLVVASAGLQFGAARAEAQTPIEVQSLAIERKLLCPQCTNLRLDVCETQLCVDMRAVIRERLAQGQSEQQIIDYFTGRYGDRVLADIPREGFNLVLFGWVGGSVLLVAALGTLVLIRLRRTATPVPAASKDTLSDAEDRWLDDQLTHESDAR
jgi:cytochrome c-type biogenesis protein CcmH